MSNKPSTSKQDVVFFEDDEMFEDSSILEKLENSSFRDISARLFESNLNESSNKSVLNVSALCCDEELSGFDKLTGATWIYPTNYPVRDYQFNIINAAILKNTLVSLPTGLGKTFIAAVIMYNFYRWYPLGKIVFTAPTRPLVAQQIEACYNIVAIPPSDTIEMTGHMQQTTRKTHWQSKRVFFATPQVIYNDIKSGVCPAEKIRCLVIDEAHRARGNYAYCQIVGTLTDMGHKLYRVLALSATPGSKVEDVINVIKNLHIAHLELRSEGCIDVAAYSHTRNIKTEIIQLGPELTALRQRYVEILDGYARNLKDLNILPHNLGNLSKGRIVMLFKEFQNKERSVRHPRHNYIMKDFMILIALFHGLELLTKHGARVFLNFFDDHPEKTWIQADDRLTSLLERLRDDLGVNPLSLNTSVLPDGTIPEIPKDICFGHPKFYRLKEIILNHFNTAKEKGLDTRAIVFCEYRESVNLVHCLLLQCRPLIKPQMFVGQGASGKDGKTVVSQKQQLRVMRSFREGGCNALVATCVAEEGLDVGSVDLIICFDISTRSPIRLVQRCGRTGRERSGQVYILVTEGREHQTLMECMRQRDGLNKKILQSREVQASLYSTNPRMLPRDLTPRCQKMFITVAKKDDKKTADGGKKGQKDLRTMLVGWASSSGGFNRETEDTDLITEQEFKDIFPEGLREMHYFENAKELWAKNKETVKSLSTESVPQTTLNLSTWLEWQRTLQKTVNIGHSKDTEILTSLLQYSDAKRFDLPPPTQNLPSFNTQDFATQNVAVTSPIKVNTPTKTKQTKKKQKIPLVKSPSKKDGDIRALFSTATKSTKNYTKFINDLGIKNDGCIPTRLLNLLVDLGVESTNKNKTCYICQTICDCALIKAMRNDSKKTYIISLQFIKEEMSKFPDLDLIDAFDTESILQCKKMSDSIDLMDVDFKEVSYLDGVDDKNNYNKNFDLEFDFGSPIDLNSPKNNVITEKESNKSNNILDKNFDIGDIEDIFADSSPEEALASECPTDDINEKQPSDTKEKDSSDPKETLGFFGLDSIDDIFADSQESNINKSSKTPHKTPCKTEIKKIEDKIHKIPTNDEYPGSPSILSGRCSTNIPTSPILCSQLRKYKLSTKKREPQSSTPVNKSTRRQLIPDKSNHKSLLTPSDKTESSIKNSLIDTSNKSMFTITQLVDMINKTGQDTSTVNNSKAIKDVDDKCNVDERSTSPILLSQANRKKLSMNASKTVTSKSNKVHSLIILESDSDSEDNTQEYNIDEINTAVTTSKLNFTEPLTPIGSNKDDLDTQDFFNEVQNSKSPSPPSNKRKLETNDSIIDSPFFNKKQKLNNNNSKPLSLQEKVIAALSSNKIKSKDFINDNSVNFMLSPLKFDAQKENQKPKVNGHFDTKTHDDATKIHDDDYIRKKNLEILQSFRRDSKVNSPKLNHESLINSQRKIETARNIKITFDDSDDDFVKSSVRRPAKSQYHKAKSLTNHKIRKKKSKNQFLDDEAELSENSRDSGDEMSDESVGSIIDFICDDDNVTHHEDMQAHYMKSIKSPVQGVFKIPQLPKNYENANIFSQYVEEDAYEMDSFCVDSHIGLTQVNDVSELEVAEMLLEKRRAKKKTKMPIFSDETFSSPVKRNLNEFGLDSPRNNDESPVVRRKKKNIPHRIQSDSEDSD